MAFPILPVVQFVALGSVKIVALGIGAVVVPKWTAKKFVNIGVSPLYGFMEYGHELDKFTPEQLQALNEALLPIHDLCQSKEEFFTRKEARIYLARIITKTAANIWELVKDTFIWIWDAIVIAFIWCQTVIASTDKKVHLKEETQRFRHHAKNVVAHIHSEMKDEKRHAVSDTQQAHSSKEDQRHTA